MVRKQKLPETWVRMTILVKQKEIGQKVTLRHHESRIPHEHRGHVEHIHYHVGLLDWKFMFKKGMDANENRSKPHPCSILLWEPFL